MPRTLEIEELASRAEDLRARLGHVGSAPVAILAGNGMAALVARRLANTVRAPLVPINPLLQPNEIAHILLDSHASHLLVEQGREHQAQAAVRAVLGTRPTLIMLAEEPLNDNEVLLFEGARSQVGGFKDEEIGSTLIYTSGTTGTPKGCFRTATQEAARARELIATYSVTSDDVQLIACPLAHSAPGIFVRAIHAVGGRSIILPRFAVDAFQEAWQAYGGSIFFLVPTQYRRLLDRFGKGSDKFWPPPSGFRTAIVAGAPLSDALRTEIQSWLGGETLWQFYGSTETGTISIASPGFTASDGVGRLAPEVEIQVRDAHGVPCQPGIHGEMFVRSPTVMSGYWPGKTLKNADGFVTVGDLGYMSESGTLHLVDRKNDTIITGGVNVYPAEVEAALLAMEGVDAAVVVGLPDDDWGQRVVALVACSSGQSADEIRQAIRSKLAAYKVPKRIFLSPLGEMPVGASGKPLRRRARDILRERESQAS